MQLPVFSVDPQGGGAVPPKPTVALILPVDQADDLFAEAFVGADIAEISAEKTIAPETGSKRGLPVSLDAKGIISAPGTARQNIGPTAETRRANRPTTMSATTIARPVADKPGNPVVQKNDAPKPLATRQVDAAIPQGPSHPEVGRVAGLIPQDHDDMIRPLPDRQAPRANAEANDQLVRPAAAIPSAHPKSAPVETTGNQVTTPLGAAEGSNRGAEIATTEPQKQAPPETRSPPISTANTRATADPEATPDTDRAPASTRRPVMHDRQLPDVPVRQVRHEGDRSHDPRPVLATDSREPAIRQSVVKPDPKLVVRQPASIKTPQPVTLPTVRSDHATRQSTPVALPSITSDKGEITVRIENRLIVQRSPKAADRPILAPPGPTPISLRTPPVSPHQAPLSPYPTPISPYSTPASGYPTPVSNHEFPDQPHPIQTPTARGASAPFPGADASPAAKIIALDRSPQPVLPNQVAIQSGAEGSRHVAAPQARVPAVSRAAPLPTPSKPTLSHMPEKLARPPGQNALDPIEQFLTLNSSDGPTSTDRTPSLGIPGRSDGGSARAELARSVAAQIGDAARATTDGKIEVRLAPEELGRVRLSMSQSEHGFIVTITAERPETLDLIRRNTDFFAQDLRHLGHQNIGFSFEQDADHQPFDDDASDPENTPENPNAPPAPGSQRTRASGLADDGHLDIRL